jgi:3'-5' exoribonuclease
MLPGSIPSTPERHRDARDAGVPAPARGARSGAAVGPRDVVVATLRAGQPLDAVFACVGKQRLRSRAGSPYLAIELRDDTGVVKARAFHDADVLAGRFERGDIVRVRGRVERFREELQVSVDAIERVDASDAEVSSFLPTSRRDLDELEGFLEHLVREVYDPGLRGLLDGLLADPTLRVELRRAPCSLPDLSPTRSVRPGAHHAFLGGLLEHTVAVASMAIELCSVHPRLDRDLLLCAAVVHDLGKTREYTYGAEIARSEEGRLLGHVELGLRLIAEHVPPSLSAQRRLALEHCVIAHHGSDSGPQLRFASAEALALYRLNALDASVKGAFERGL